MNRTMNAELFDRYRNLTAASVLAMSGEVEDRRLDCKLVEAALSSKDDKKNLAKALSGFANAEGGIVLWGVSAKKNAQGIDCIDGHPGVEDWQRLLSRLQDLTGQAVSPGVVGVDHRSLIGEAACPAFVATYVPQSDAGPHMAMLGEGRYYQRIGSSTLPMEHFQIADMFGRRAQPKLELELVQTYENVLSVVLRNAGRGTARAPYVMLRVREPYIPAPYPETGKATDFPLPKLVGSAVPGWGAYVGDMNSVLHPGIALQFRAIQPPAISSGQLPTHCFAEYKFGAVGASERSGSFTYDFSMGRIEQWSENA
jgi:hypothetical protein